MVKGLKAIVVLMLITAAFNLFLTPGTPIVKFWIFKITAEGAQNAILMAIRLTYLILGTSIMTLTTTPNQLTDGLEVKNMIPLLVPLFVSAFRRADDLAMAMEARCYNGGEGRTKMKPLRYAGVDHKAYVLVIGYFVVILLCRFFLPFPQ